MPSLLDKIKNRWYSGTAQAPNYGPIGPTDPRNARASWRQRLARWIGSGQSTPLRTASYRPLHQAWFNQPRDLPPFSFETINSMLLDPGIRLNLAMRAAPIYGVQFAYPSGVDASGKTVYQPGIQARNPAVAAWVARQLSTIWHNDLPAILRVQIYGWAGGEVSLRLSDQNFIEIDRLVARHPGDVRLLKCEGERYGVKVLRVQEGGEVNLEFPSAWFHAFRPDDGEDYGTSILLGAYSPWADKWFNGGALDTRRLFMHKDAYGGMKIAYPEEDIYIGNEVNPVSARDIAAQMSSQISRSISFNRVPWDPLKHPRGRDGRFIEKYGIDAFNQSKAKINQSLDPNASPTTGRTSDEVRPLLEHLNLLDQSQLSNLVSGYKVAPEQTSVSPFADAIHHQVYGEAFNKKPLLKPLDEKPQYENAVIRKGDPPADLVKLVSTGDSEQQNGGHKPSPSPSDKDWLERAGIQQGDSSTDDSNASSDGPLAQSENSDGDSSDHESTPSKMDVGAVNTANGPFDSERNNTLGVEDVPADFDPNRKWNSPGERLSAYIRSQHKAAFDLADQIIQTRDSLLENYQERLKVEESLRTAIKGSRNEQDLQARLKQLKRQCDILERQEAMFTERLNTEYADLQLPGFSVEIGFNRQWTIPGGVGGQAVLDRALRDLSGYNTDPSLHPDEHEVFRNGSYGQEPEINGVPTLGFEDLPEHVKNYNNKSEGKALSNYTRNQHGTAFQLADQIIDSAQVIAKADEDIAQLETELQQANSESAKQEVKKRLDWARSSNEIRKRDTQKLVDELHQKHGNVVIPSFRYDGLDGKSRVAGGIGVEAIIARALRDRDGYGATHLYNDNASLIYDHKFDFDLAGKMSRGIGLAGRKLIEKLVENGKKLITPPAPQSDEAVSGGDTRSKLPIPKPSSSLTPLGSLDESLAGTLDADGKAIPPDPRPSTNNKPALSRDASGKDNSDELPQSLKQEDLGDFLGEGGVKKCTLTVKIGP